MDQLRALAPRGRAAFAFICADAIVPVFRAYSQKLGIGAPDQLDRLAEILWQSLANSGKSSELVEAMDTCESLIPDENESWDQETQPFAEDAAASLTFAFRTRLGGGSEDAFWAAQRVLECYDYKLREDDRLETRGLLEDPRIEAELERQQRALVKLAEVDSPDTDCRHLLVPFRDEGRKIFSQVFEKERP